MVKEGSEKNWLRFLVLIYSLAFCFLLVAALVTGYILSHPEYGGLERTPFIRALLSEYGLILGLFLTILYNTLTTFFFWPFFMIYLKAKRKYELNNFLMDSVVYSWMSAFGLSHLILWLADALNDVSYLLFQTSYYVIVAMLESATDVFFLTLLISFVFFLIAHHLISKRYVAHKKLGHFCTV